MSQVALYFLRMSSCFLRVSPGSAVNVGNILYEVIKYVEGGVWVIVNKFQDDVEVVNRKKKKKQKQKAKEKPSGAMSARETK